MSLIPLDTEHSDYEIISPIVNYIIGRVGNIDQLSLKIPPIFRQAVDEVIDAPRTNRFTIDELEKTEKTYLGTKVEILLRNLLKLPKGNILDLSIEGVEVDIKNTIGQNWTIPLESYNRPAILTKFDEKKAICSFGVIYIRPEYLNVGKNRDSKRSISITGKNNIWWILKDYPYSKNFWETIPESEINFIISSGKGTLRIATFFEKIQGVPISRQCIHDIAQQNDYMKRIRKNGGARDILNPKKIAILWGKKDRTLIAELGLPILKDDEFISYKAITNDAFIKLSKAGHL
ncbi:NaeI family type II restriction endonuclease [Microvirga sp. W0021]|uniref:NaeI family type II restriction endonuclease n=1 Tax=Hohaiivirga grylli TaxID=3133970 RepID=A0ABV0BIN0_9HYPH